MSLFEDSRFQWRETYFVLFDEKKRPTAEQMRKALDQPTGRFEITDPRSDERGAFESLTLFSHADAAAMDISYVGGEDVADSIQEVCDQLQGTKLSSKEADLLRRVKKATARVDIYHFEEVAGAEDEEMLDPGALLLVIERVAELCGGVGFDPQAGELIQ